MKYHIIAHLTANEKTPDELKAFESVRDCITKRGSHWPAAIQTCAILFGTHSHAELEEHFQPAYYSMTEIAGRDLKEWPSHQQGNLRLVMSPAFDELYYLQVI